MVGVKNSIKVEPGEKEPVPGPLAAYEIDRECLAAGRILGAGQYGGVHFATESHPDGTIEGSRAVKLLRNASTLADRVADVWLSAETRVADHEILFRPNFCTRPKRCSSLTTQMCCI